MASSLLPFLCLARNTVFEKSAIRSLVVVLGNTSADLDSFISAVIFAYFHTRRADSIRPKFYVPLLNLTDVPSSELWRLRPEYGTALRLAINGLKTTLDNEDNKEVEKSLLKDLITIKDVRENSDSRLRTSFAAKSEDDAQATSRQDVVLVDHNALQVPGLSSDDLTSHFNLVGVVDHHVDENTVFAETNPRIIKTGIGSCTSLVVQHLECEGLWPAPPKGHDDYVALAKLALAPILIDTANLKAVADKTSNTDRDAVKFLESHIVLSDPDFDRTAFYEAIQTSKSNKLQLLTMNEVFESDYKEWTEQPSSTSKPLNIGIASLVKDLPWLIRHAGSAAKLSEAMDSFAKKSDHELSIFCLITKGNGPDGEFRKELAIIAYGEEAIKALNIFWKDADELRLGEWKADENILKALDKVVQKQDVNTAYKLWWQGDVSRTRKQVAPLLRDAVKKA